jgi:hypothetical protein
MSSLINWEVARGRAEEARESGLKPLAATSVPRGVAGGRVQQNLDLIRARALEILDRRPGPR